MKQSVWAASSGSYSDYRIGCLFTTEEEAEAYVSTGAEGFVEEFALYSDGQQPRIYMVYSAQQRVDEDEMREWSYKAVEGHYAMIGPDERPRVTATKFRGGPIEYSITAHALTPDLARKVVADRVAQNRYHITEAGLDFRTIGSLQPGVKFIWAEDLDPSMPIYQPE